MRRVVRVDRLGPSALLALVCLVLATCAPGAFALRREALIAGEWWRLWSAHVVHWSTLHALLDASVLGVCGAIAERGFGRRFVAAALLAGAPAIALVCLAATALDEYRGASGLGVLLGVLAGAAVWRAHPAQRGWVFALGLAMGAKTLADVWLPALTLTALPPGVRVAWPAHVAGAAVAALALILRAVLRYDQAAHAAAGVGVSTK